MQYSFLLHIKWIYFSPHISTCIICLILVVAILSKQKSYLTMVLVCLSARISDIAYFPTYLLVRLLIWNRFYYVGIFTCKSLWKHRSEIPVPFRKLVQPSTWNTNGLNEDAASCKQMIRFAQERINRSLINKLLVFLEL